MWSWLANPWMMGLGGLAVSLPILIHLLNKRRFKIVEWAAMDFLFDAEKKNRRRVQLENFLLLLLRCLAMFLIGLLLARPFLPSSVTQFLAQKPQFERVVLLDDSLSQNVVTDGEPGIDKAKTALAQFMKQLSEVDDSDNWITVLLTSSPDQPLIANEPLTPTTLPALAEIVDDIEISDGSVNYSLSLNSMNRYVSGERENASRVAYLFSDMREHDWRQTGDDSSPEEQLKGIANKAASTFMIDTGGPADNNLAITSIRPDDLQVSDKVIRFIVEITNFGRETVNDVRILMQVDDQPPDYETVASITPGETEQVTLRYIFNRSIDPSASMSSDSDANLPQFRNFRITAEIDRQGMAEDELKNDQLRDDSKAFFAARVLNGIKVLLVDGDPSSVSERSETHYLKSLDVLGTGLDIDVVSVSDFESVSLSNYRAIFLCNVDETSNDRIKSLEQWIADGGALVIMPGNRVQATRFNETFYRDGNGLSPIGLLAMNGDPTMSRWVNFELDVQIHPAFKLIVDTDSTSISNVDVFSWWTSTMDREKLGKDFVVPLRLTDADNSPAMAEKSIGNGNVVVFALPADGDWSMWPSSVTYVPVMLDLIDYLVGEEADESQVAIGGSLKQAVDLSVFSNRVALIDAEGEKIESIAKPTDDSEEAKSSEIYEIEFDQFNRRGFYEVSMQRHAGEKEITLYASNVDASEGDLKRVADSVFEDGYFGDKVRWVSSEDLVSQSIQGAETEIWPLILILLFATLVLEQTLGWWFGSKR